LSCLVFSFSSLSHLLFSSLLFLLFTCLLLSFLSLSLSLSLSHSCSFLFSFSALVLSSCFSESLYKSQPTKKIFRFDYSPTGPMTGKTLFAEMGAEESG